jgi:hypothetical protein
MITAVVGGALANKAGYGGEAWVRMSWILGLRRLGVDAWLVEDLESITCVDRQGVPATPADSYNVAYFQEVVEAFGLGPRALLRVDRGAEIYGAAPGCLRDLAADAELVLNFSGHLPAATLFPRARRVYIDIDPGWTQWWVQSGQVGARIAGHHAFYTLAENIGRADCPIPTAGLPWRTVRQPVVLADWPVTPGPGPGRFTTVATWRHPYGPVGQQLDGSGLKHHEFRRFVELAGRSAAVHELALRSDPADRADIELLRSHGWKIAEAVEVARTPADFQLYVQDSSAEFSPAQGVYVRTGCGWFSDRTARYLASGRPAVVQDTGLGSIYPLGEGLLTFDSVESALAAEERIARDYGAHADAARSLAERFFDSDEILGRLLDEVGLR